MGMGLVGYRRLAIFGLLTSCLLAFWIVHLYVRMEVSRMHLTSAEARIRIIKLDKEAALESDPKQMVAVLDDLVLCSPAPNQTSQSPLDRIVARYTESAVQEILRKLQVKTGKNLGDDPNAWIDAFKPKKN